MLPIHSHPQSRDAWNSRVQSIRRWKEFANCFHCFHKTGAARRCGKKLPAYTLLASLFASGIAQSAGAEEPGWVALFDGHSLDGWTASEHKESCRVEDGVLALGGERSHLFYSGPVDDHDFTDFELKLEVKTTPGSNSGVFFHTEYQETDWPAQGHEAQVNNTQEDWRRTGSLYSVKDIRESPVKDDEWFEYHIIVRDNHVTFKINGETVNEYTESPEGPQVPDRADRKLSHGTIALQAHDPGSLVYYRNIRIKTPTTAQSATPACRPCCCNPCCP